MIIYNFYIIFVFIGRVVYIDGAYAAVKFPCVSKDISGIFPKDPTAPANDDSVTTLIKVMDQNEVRLMKKDDLQVNIVTLNYIYSIQNKISISGYLLCMGVALFRGGGLISHFLQEHHIILVLTADEFNQFKMYSKLH